MQPSESEVEDQSGNLVCIATGSVLGPALQSVDHEADTSVYASMANELVDNEAMPKTQDHA